MKRTPDDVHSILDLYDDEKHTYWKLLLKYHHVSPSGADGHSHMEKVLPWFVVVSMLRLAYQDLLNREEIAFFNASGKPYMLWFIKDMRFVFNKIYRYRDKFRGHNYKFYSYIYPYTQRMIKGKFLDMYAGGCAYWDLSLKVQRGYDYDACPNLPVLYKLRKPVKEK